MATGSGELNLDPTFNQYVYAIVSSLEHDETNNAIALAERFVAARPNRSEPTYLLAKAHAQAGAKRVAVKILEQELKYPPSRFLYARCCFELDQAADAERALHSLLNSAKYEPGGGTQLSVVGEAMPYPIVMTAFLSRRTICGHEAGTQSGTSPAGKGAEVS